MMRSLSVVRLPTPPVRSKTLLLAVIAVLSGFGSYPSASQETRGDSRVVEWRHQFAGYWERGRRNTAVWWPSGVVSSPEGIPFTPEGLARHEIVEAGVGDEYLEIYAPFRCEFYLGLIMTFGSVEILTQPDDRVVMVYPTYENEVRWAWTDGRNYPEGALERPMYMGYSVAQWEDGDDGLALVIETAGLEPGFMRQEGIPYTQNARITERYTLSEDGQRLDLEVTLDDPKYYTRPLKVEGMNFAREEPPVALYPTCRLGPEYHRIGGQ